MVLAWICKLRIHVLTEWIAANQMLNVVRVGALLLGVSGGCGKTPDPALTTDNNPIKAGTTPARILEQDFGIVGPNEYFRRTFAVKNTSMVEWHLRDVRKGCSCVSVVPSKSRLKPNDVAQFEVTVKSGSSANRLSRQEVVVNFQEASAPVFVLRLTATVKRELNAVPELLSLGRTSRGKNATGVIRLENFSGAGWKSVVLRDCPEWLSARFDRVTEFRKTSESQEPSEIWLAALQATTSDLPNGETRGELVFVADDKWSTRVDVHMFVEPPISAIPAHIVLLQDDSGNSAASTTVLFSESLDPPDPQKTTFKCSLAGIDAGWRSTVGTRWILEVRNRNVSIEKNERAEIAIDFGDDQCDELRLPVICSAARMRPGSSGGDSKSEQ